MARGFREKKKRNEKVFVLSKAGGGSLSIGDLTKKFKINRGSVNYIIKRFKDRKNSTILV